METIIIETDAAKTKWIKEFLNAFGVDFKTKKETIPYNEEFVNKILTRSRNAKQGKVIVYDNKLKKELFGV